ncbi:DUF3617 domain-containing protein [Robiginitomaculum antarcticum]|uniref:DUF3617 domain-containing protein n=1 Tax=Robiginitomaculum antarcticum TaxID=437507 RepID=UPI00037CECED|nr:DUF3617 family protein [Robiginitomaculum antarcticum]
MKYAIMAAAVTALGLSSLAAAKDSLTFEAGQYQITTSLKMGGQSVNDDVSVECLTEEESTVSYAKLEEMMGDDFSCSFDNMSETSNRIATDVSCKMSDIEGDLSGRAVVEHTQTSFDLNFDGTTDVFGSAAPVELDISGVQISDSCS